MGERPRIFPTELPQNFADEANNVYLKRGVIEPCKQPKDSGLSLRSSTKSVFHYSRDANNGNGFWFEWDSLVNAVPSPIADDQYDRVYYTGDGAPKMAGNDVATQGAGPYPSVAYDLGLPAPEQFDATGPEGDPPDGAQSIDAVYVMTFVSKYGEEGPPSLSTAPVTRWDGGDVVLSSLPIPNGNFVSNTKRLYRQELQSGVWQLAAELPATTTSYTDSALTSQLGTVMVSETWLAPNVNMVGLTALPNGVFMGWWDSTIAFSEPYQPHAWPIEYRYKLSDKIVGAGRSSTGILVATEGKPVLLHGSHPSTFSETKLDAAQGCLSPRSVVDLGSNVVFASSEGLVGSGGNITAEHITAEQWADLNPESFHAYRWRDRYLSFYDNGQKGAFTFHPSEGFLFYTFHADFGYQDEKTGKVFLIDDQLLEWFAGNDAIGIWRSKVFESRLLQAPKVAKIEAETYPVIFRYYTDGVIKKTFTVASRRAFRLPSTDHADQWQAEVSGNTVTAIHIASSMSEV